MRRVSVALAASLAFHVAVAVVTLGLASLRGLGVAREVEVVPITVESVRELPLGPPPAAAPTPSGEAGVVARPRRHARIVAHRDGTLPSGGPDAGAAPDASPPAPDGKPGRPLKPGDLQSYGPEGSRLTALLRLD